MKTHHVAASLIALHAAVSCASPEQVHVAPLRGVVPSSSGGAWVFAEAGAAHPDHGAVPYEGALGALRCTAKDQSSGYGVAVYDGALAVVDIENDLVEWSRMTLPEGPAFAAIGSGAVGVVAGKSASIIGLPDAELRSTTDLADWLNTFSVRYANYVVPVRDTELLLVSSRLPSAFTDSRVLVQRIDYGGGRWELLRGEGDVAGLTRLGACTNVGETLYLGGVRETLAPGAGQSRGSLHENVVVHRYDIESGQSRLVVNENQMLPGARVIDLGAGRDPETGDDMVSVLSANGELCVYAIPESGTTSAALFRNTFEGATSTAWVDPGRIAVDTPAGVQFVEIQRR